MPELSQSENAGANRRDRNLYSGQRGSTKRRTRRTRKRRTSEWPFFMHESVNYGMEGGARGCRGSVMPPPSLSASVLPFCQAAAPWGSNCAGILSILPSYFLPVPKMGTTSRRDGVIAKCEKSRRGRRGERERVSIFSPLKFVSPRRFSGMLGGRRRRRGRKRECKKSAQFAAAAAEVLRAKHILLRGAGGGAHFHANKTVFAL